MDKIQELLTRGVEEVIDKPELETALRSKRKLRVKLGIDPTSPNIHIGRAVVLWKLRAFQELGHQVVFIVGDFTGLIGDTSDKEAERPMLGEAEIKKNLKTYFEQAFRILDKKKTETHYNSKWLKKLGFLEIGKMADLFGLHEMAARENVAKRLQAGKRVSFRELLYPIMQGYDSVAIKADVELGGTDQRFNLLAGRTIQPAYGQKPQNILTTQLMEGTDGRKMSSSWGNVINITDEPNEMFGKVMSIDDNLIKKYFVLATRVEIKDIEEIMSAGGGSLPAGQAGAAGGKLPNPRDQKLKLAQEIVSLYYGMAAAKKTKDAFISQFSKGQLPEDIEIKEFDNIQPMSATDYLVTSGLISSKSEGRRLIRQGGIKIDGAVLSEDINFQPSDKPALFQVGKRKYIKIKAKK